MKLPAQYHECLREAIAKARARQERKTDRGYVERLVEAEERLLRTHGMLAKASVKLVAETKRANEWRGKARAWRKAARSRGCKTLAAPFGGGTEASGHFDLTGEARVVDVRGVAGTVALGDAPPSNATNRVVLEPRNGGAVEIGAERVRGYYAQGVVKPKPTTAERLVKKANRLHEQGKSWALVAWELGIDRRQLYDARMAASGNGRAR